jgi:hypothetical protein
MYDMKRPKRSTGWCIAVKMAIRNAPYTSSVTAVAIPSQRKIRFLIAALPFPR